MAIFVLDRWTINAGSLEARFTQGPVDAPVAYVQVDGLEDASAAEAYFSGLQPFEEDIFVSESSGTILIQGEYEEPLALRGQRVSMRSSSYEAVDFERSAKLYEEWGKSMQDAWQALNARVVDVRHFLTEQKRRLQVKAARRPVDSTVHQLYEQQISFIDRVLSKLDT